MSLDVASIVALTLCLCACTSAIPEGDFLEKGTTVSVENEVNEMGLPSFGDSFVELIGCRDLGRIRVYTAGQVSFLPSDVEANVENLVLDVFTVDYAEINKAHSSVYYRTIVPNGDFRTTIIEDFEKYFPRRSIGPDFVVVVTWDLMTNSSQRDLFQCVIVFDVDEHSVFIIYQYADTHIEWPESTDADATFPSVGAEVCGGEDFPPYEIDDSGTSAIINRVQIEIISGVQPVGKVAFLIDDGPDPDSNDDPPKTVDVIYNHIPCADSVCSLSNGHCEVANTCICNDNGWIGTDCKTPSCPNNPCVNGDCTAPHTCSCDSGYTGDRCNTLQCDADEKCENGGICLVDPLNECSCPADMWTGDTCTTPICTPACANGDCTAPNTCSCPDGQWTGDACETAICAQTCHNGGCTDPNTCTCVAGWTGDDCNTAMCDSINCENGGICSAPNTCQCTDGVWSGLTCTDPVCNPPCNADHGTCTSPNTCQCSDDYTGNLCEIPPPPPSIIPTTTTIPPATTSIIITEPTEGSTDAQLSAAAIGGIVGGIVGFAILLIIMAFVIIGAFCAM